MFTVPYLKDFVPLTVENGGDGLWVNFQDVYTFLKKHHSKTDTVKEIKKYNLIKEFKRHGTNNYKEIKEEVFVGVASLLRYFCNHYDHLKICRDVVHQILEQIISPPVNSDKGANDKSIKEECMEIQVNTEWLPDDDNNVPGSGLKLHMPDDVKVKEEPEECGEFQAQKTEDEDAENLNRNNNSSESSSSNDIDKLTAYEKHLKFHKDEKSFQCDYCDAAFKSDISKTLDTEDNLSQIEKSITTKILVNEKKDTNHTVKAKSQTKKKNGFKTESELEKKYVCQHCGQKFKRKGSLSGHLMTHEEKKTFVCSTCNKVYNQKSLLSYHERTHSGVRPYVCKICGGSFTLKSRLNRHLKRHSGEKPYSCNICKASFLQAYDLTQHLRIHSGEKPFVCEFCSAAFTQSSNLTLHLRTHTKEKPYVCHICDARFAHSSFLTRHLRIHSGVKPYKCHICSVAFTQSSNLTCHLRTHSGEKPYQCEICLSSFTQSSNLKHHMKVHTPAIFPVLRPKIQTSNLKIKRNNPPIFSFDLSFPSQRSSFNAGEIIPSPPSLDMSVDSESSSFDTLM